MNDKVLKSSIIGFGKRMREVTLPVLLKHPSFEIVTVNTKTNKQQDLIRRQGFEHSTKIQEILKRKIDIIVISVPPNQIREILNELRDFKGIILTETPVSNSVIELIFLWLKFNKRPIYYLEQFIHSPYEIYKRELADKFNMSSPVLCLNNNRFFAYHGIALARSYFRDLGKLKKISTLKTIIPDSGETLRLGILEFQKGIIQHNFSSDIKKSKFREEGQFKVWFKNGYMNENEVVTDSIMTKMNLSYRMTEKPPKHLVFRDIVLWQSPDDSFSNSQCGIYEILTLISKRQYNYNITECCKDTLLNKMISLDQKFPIPKAYLPLLWFYNLLCRRS